MFKSIKKNQKGFTLVELVIVIAILAILAALLVPRIMGNVDTARRSTALANARTLASEITTHNALIKVNGTGTPIPASLPTAGTTVTLQSTTPGTTTTYYDGSYGALPTSLATVVVDSAGNATVDDTP